MNIAAGPELAAAVSNAGGLGVIGGLGYAPKILRQQVHSCVAFLQPAFHLSVSHDVKPIAYLLQINEVKNNLHDKNAPFGVDLLIPQIGGNARKTNVC